MAHIAIVEDDASTRQALARLLHAYGVNSRGYRSPRAFLKALPSDMPYCLIVDVHMPGMTGFELQRELLNRGVRIPTIVITAADDETIAASAAAHGASSLLRKPIAHDALMAAINSAAKSRN